MAKELTVAIVLQAYNKTQKEIAEIKRSISDISKQVKENTKAAESFSSALKDVSSSFREIRNIAAGIGLAFSVSEIIRETRELISVGLRYNRTIESTKVGLAGILSSIGQIKDSTGNLLQGQQKFNAALQISADLISQLQQESLKTTATFQELVQAFQGVAGSALSAGLSLEQVVKLTTVAVNATKALGLPMEQVVQEVRDLMTGGIQTVSSQLAVALGITNEMVNKWREQGRLFEELNKRLEGFRYASNELSNTWEGLFSNLQDVVEKALGEGTQPLFDYVKSQVQEIINYIAEIKRNAEGKIIDIHIREDVIEKVKELSKAIIEVIEDIKNLVKSSVSFYQQHERLINFLAKTAIVVWIAYKLKINEVISALIRLRITALTASVAIGKLNTSLKANVIGLAITGLMAVGEVISWIKDKFKESTDQVDEFISKLKQVDESTPKGENLKRLEEKLKGINQVQRIYTQKIKETQEEIERLEERLKELQKAKKTATKDWQFKSLTNEIEATTLSIKALQNQIQNYKKILDPLLKEKEEIERKLKGEEKPKFKFETKKVAEKIDTSEIISKTKALVEANRRFLSELDKATEIKRKISIQLKKAQIEFLKETGAISLKDYFEKQKKIIEEETNSQIAFIQKQIEREKEAFKKIKQAYLEAIEKESDEKKKEKLLTELSVFEKEFATKMQQYQNKILQIREQQRLKEEKLDFKFKQSKLKILKELQKESLDLINSEFERKLKKLDFWYAEELKKVQENEALKTKLKELYAKKREKIVQEYQRAKQQFTISLDIQLQKAKESPFADLNEELNALAQIKQRLEEELNNLKVKGLMSDEEYNIQLKKINELFTIQKKKAVENWQAQYKGLKGANLALKELWKEYSKFGEFVNGELKNLAYAVEQHLGDELFNALIGKGKKLKEIFQDISKMIVRTIIEIGLRLAVIKGFEAVGIKVPGKAEGGEVKKYATGGWIKAESGGKLYGGIPNKDSIPILAMEGEYVIRKKAVEYYGSELFEKLNQMKIPKYERGGYVSKSILASNNTNISEEKNVVINYAPVIQSLDPYTAVRYLEQLQVDQIVKAKFVEEGLL